MSKAPLPAPPRRYVPPPYRLITTLAVQPLPERSTAFDFLAQLERLFTPLLHRRGFHIQSLREMCCCGRGRMGKNHGVLGYCMPMGDKKRSRGIYIRLRHPVTHAFYDLESLKHTMAHEVTHILHSKHSVEFYEEMGRIRQEMEETKDDVSYQVFGGLGFRTGGAVVQGGPLSAAARRQKLGRLMPGARALGGDAPRDRSAVLRAAEERSKRDAVVCGDVVEIPEEDEDDGGEEDSHAVAGPDAEFGRGEGEEGGDKPTWECLACSFWSKAGVSSACELCGVSRPAREPPDPWPASPAQTTTAGASKLKEKSEDDCLDVTEQELARAHAGPMPEVIDLTGGRGGGGLSPLPPSPPPREGASGEPKKRRRRGGPGAGGDGGWARPSPRWSCPSCTFMNASEYCGACGGPSPGLIEGIRREDRVLDLKEGEKRRAMEEFGFDIYGSGRQATRQGRHLT